jgi:hypothetical protein
LAICLACGPAIKRLLRAVSYRKQYAAFTLVFHSRCALLASRYRKKFAAYLIGLRVKSKRLLPEFLDNPIRVAFIQKRQFQGALDKKVRILWLHDAAVHYVPSFSNLNVPVIIMTMLRFRSTFCTGTSVFFA